MSKVPPGQLPAPPAPFGLQIDIDAMAGGCGAPRVAVGADVGAAEFVGEGSARRVSLRVRSCVGTVAGISEGGGDGAEVSVGKKAHAASRPSARMEIVDWSGVFIIASLWTKPINLG